VPIDGKGTRVDNRTPLTTPCTKEQVESLIQNARDGSTVALGQRVDASRSYLLAVARRSLPSSLQAKLSPSDLVQEAALEAHRDFAMFQGEQREELFAWLRRILLNNVANVRRHFEETAKRDVSLEVAWEQVASCAIVDLIHDPRTPCSQLVSLEQRNAMEEALSRLPADLRNAIELRNKEHLSFAEIGAQMKCSPSAARKLWARAIERLRHMLAYSL